MSSPPRPLPRLELRCFGAPTALLDGAAPPAEVVWRKHLALLIYLALSPERSRSRDHLLGLLWPEKPEAQARHSLNEAIRRLRTHLGADRLLSRGDAVTLSGAELDVDVLRFERLAGAQSGDAVAVLRGDFLEGFTVDDAHAFDEWANVERTRWRARGSSVLTAAGEQALAACDYVAAQDLARRALALQPYAEPAVRLLMRAAALAGDSSGALATHREFAARLEAEIGEQPSPDLAALAERIRRRVWQGARAGAAPEGRDEPSLVGRAEQHRAAFALLDEALRQRAGPRTLCITGDPGAGRSRLLQECLTRAGLEGAVVAAIHPLESDYDAPWSSLRALLRAGLLGAPGLAGVNPEDLGVLAGIVPDLADRVTPRPPGDRARVAAALAALLAALTDEQPVVVGVDDAHFADGASLEAIATAVARTSAAPLALVLTSLNASEDQPKELLRLRAAIGRSLPGTVVRLDALGEPEMRQLVAQLAPWCVSDAERERLARRLRFETGGNLFLAVTLLQALQKALTLRQDVLAWPRPRLTLESPLPISIPDLARMAVITRVAELDEETRRVVRAASIGGLAIDLDVLAALTELPRPAVEARLHALEQHHFVAFDGERYVFAAPLIAQVVRGECIPAGQRHRLRQRAVAALAGRGDLESRLLRADLLAKIEPGDQAVAEAVATARAALAVGSRRTARHAIAAVERAAAGKTPPELTELRDELARLELQGR